MKSILTFAFAAPVLVSITVAAQEAAPITTDLQGDRVWLDAVAWPSPDADIFAFSLNGQRQLHKNILLHLEIPAAVGQVSGEPAPHAAGGNVIVGMRAIGAVAPVLVVWGDLSVAVPSLYRVPATNDGIASSSIALLAAYSREGFDVDRFYPETTFARAEFGLEGTIKRFLRYRFDISGLVGIPVGPDTTALVPGLQSSSEFQGEFANHLYLGLRLQASGFTLSLAGGGFIGYEPPGRGFVFRIDTLVGSQPYQVSTYVGGVFWSASTRLGYKF